MLEESILGSCMISENALSVATELLRPSHFTGENREIFSTFIRLRKENKKVDLTTVSTIYKNLSYLVGLTDNIATTRNIESHCKQLVELGHKRRIKRFLTELALEVDNIDLQTVLSKMQGLAIPTDINALDGEIRDLDINPYNGITNAQNNFIPTGLPTIDYALNDLVGGMVTLVGGRNNGGKTTFCTQVIANAIDKGKKVLMINGEEKQEVLINKFYTSVIGRNAEYYEVVRVNKRYRKEPIASALVALMQWHENKLKMFTKENSTLKTTDQLFELLGKEMKRSSHDIIVIDNLMSILTGVADIEKNGKQAEFMQKCCDLAKHYNCHIVLVLHPNKTYRKGEEMESEQISGTSDLANKADNIITIIREYNEDVLSTGVNGWVQVQKNREYSDLPKVPIHFEESTGLLLEINDEEQYVAYNFKWHQFL